MTRNRLFAVAIGAATALLGCRQEMYDQPKNKPLGASAFFADGTSARPPVPETIARGLLPVDSAFSTGKADGQYVQTFPLDITRDDLERGRQRYEIYCAPCHARTGDGDGMIVRHGFRKPVSFHDARLRAAAPGYYYDVITNGFGTMYPYGDRISPRDRWLVAAYVLVLQRSQAGTIQDVPEDERMSLDSAP